MNVKFKVNKEEVAAIKEMMKEVGLKTERELLNHAITAFGWIISEKKKGHVIASVDEKNNVYKELIMTCFTAEPETSSITVDEANAKAIETLT